MQTQRRLKKDFGSRSQNKIIHLSPVPNTTEPLSRLSNRVGELERTELNPRILSYCLYAILVLIMVSCIWVTVVQIDMVAVAPGRLVPIGQVKLIQPEVDGVIESVLVREGERVQAGATLIVLEKSKTKEELVKQTANVNIAKTKVAACQKAVQSLEAALSAPGLPLVDCGDVDGAAAAIADLNRTYLAYREAEFDSKLLDGIGPSESSALMAESRSLVRQKQLHTDAASERSRERQSRLEEQTLEVQRLKTTLESARAELTHLETIQNATAQQEVSFRGVFQQGAVSRVDYLTMLKELERAKREVIQQESKIETLVKQIDIAECQLAEARSGGRANDLEKRAQIVNLDLEHGKVRLLQRDFQRKRTLALASFKSAESTVRAVLTRIKLTLDEKQHTLKEAEAQTRIAEHDFTVSEIKAPVDGVVTGLRLRGRGQVVRRGERLMSVVPKGAKLAFEVTVPNKDSGFLRAGQTAKIKLAAYPFEDFGVLNGQVTHVEATSTGGTNQPSAFIAQVVPDKQYVVAHGQKRPLISGMAATCEIVTRRRPLINILFEPLNRVRETRWQ